MLCRFCVYYHSREDVMIFYTLCLRIVLNCKLLSLSFMKSFERTFIEKYLI